MELENKLTEGTLSESILEAPPEHFITIRIGDYGDPVVDLGDLSYFEARGLMEVAIEDVRMMSPGVTIRHFGEVVQHSFFDFDDDDEEEEED